MGCMYENVDDASDIVVGLNMNVVVSLALFIVLLVIKQAPGNGSFSNLNQLLTSDSSMNSLENVFSDLTAVLLFSNIFKDEVCEEMEAGAAVMVLSNQESCLAQFKKFY